MSDNAALRPARPRAARLRRVLSGGAVAAGATALGLTALAAPAQASTTHDWTGVAQCESGGDWHIATGNGFYGGLQFTASTWAAYGGTAYAARADQASPSEQVAVAERVLAGQGIGAWPVCGRYLTGGSTTVADAGPVAAPAPKAAPVVAAPKVAPKAAPKATASAPVRVHTTAAAAPAGAADYTVRPGDTLGKIAAAHGLASWRTIYDQNRATIANPNLIFVGQVLHF